MKNNARMIFGIVLLIVGILLVVCSSVGLVDFIWSGYGVGAIAGGILLLVKQMKYRSNKAYKDEVDIAQNDERNKYISNKAWAWTGYISVILLLVSTIVLEILGYGDYSQLCSMVMCALVVIYSFTYLILNRKY